MPGHESLERFVDSVNDGVLKSSLVKAKMPPIGQRFAFVILHGFFEQTTAISGLAATPFQ
jgi:hypothetical protein